MAETGAAGVVGMGAVGIAMSAAVSGSSGISVVKGINMQNDQRLHQRSYVYIYIKKKKRKKDGRESLTSARNTYL